jgi:dTDP-4-dehydrorhamnose 3,5-epimerase
MSIQFDIKESDLVNGVKIISPSISADARGDIWTSYTTENLHKIIPENLSFKHDKFSQSKKNVLRGLHGDNKSWKFVTCVYGEIYQVVADLREDSDTYSKWQGFDICKANQKLILIPPGVANAYYVKSNEAVYHYKLAYEGNYIDADEQFTVSWNDPRFNISWPTKRPILSIRDAEVQNGTN